MAKCCEATTRVSLKKLAARSLLIASTLILLWSTCLSGIGQAQDTPDYFRANCLSCHTIGGGNLAGPDLKGLSARKDRDWLINFLLDPRGVIESGDPYAQKLLEDAGGKVLMPTGPGMNRERAEKLLDLIDAESKLPNSQFKGLQISNKPFTDENRKRGRQLFLGRERLEAGGTACIACHSVHGAPLLGGGQLGPNLTGVFEELKGRKALSAWLMAPSTETMQPIFKKHPLSADEIHDFVAYFQSLAGETATPPSSQRVTFLVLGLLGGALLVLVCDAIWKRRFRGVREPLVQATTARGR